MCAKLIAEKKVIIQATPQKIWKVLTSARFIRKWDSLPKGYGTKPLELETVLTWKQSETDFTELTVTAFEPEQHLRQALYVSTWNNLPAEPVTYNYMLARSTNGTKLTVTAGDFSSLEDGLIYYKNANEFLRTATRRIKELAEEG